MAGVDNLDAEQIVEEAVPALEEIVRGIVETGEVPGVLKGNLIIPIQKEGRAWDRTEGYRPINVLTSAAKVVDKALAMELGGVVGVDGAQFAYQPGLSGENMVMEICGKNNGEELKEHVK